MHVMIVPNERSRERSIVDERHLWDIYERQLYETYNVSQYTFGKYSIVKDCSKKTSLNYSYARISGIFLLFCFTASRFLFRAIATPSAGT